MPVHRVQRFGEKLRTLRTARNLTVRALAAAIEVSHSAIVEIENGNNRPSIDFIYAIARYFDISTDDLLDDEREV